MGEDSYLFNIKARDYWALCYDNEKTEAEE